jgi:cell division protein FtsQ
VTPANRRVIPAPREPGDESEVQLEHQRESGPEPNRSTCGPPKTPSRWAAIARTLLGIATIVGASFGAAWLTHRHVTTSPRFSVRSVQVVGNDRRAADAVAVESGLALGMNVFTVDLDSARARILGDPWVADAALARRLPGTIVIQVTERVPAALVAIGDLVLVDADGSPFKKLEPGDPVELPLITGLTEEGINDDRPGACRTIRRAIGVAAEYTRSALAKRASLQEVHVDAGGTFTLVVGRSAMQLALGGPPFRRKLDEASRVVTELDRRRVQATAIMLDNEARPERVVARLR